MSLDKNIRNSFCDTCNKKVLNLIKVSYIKQKIQDLKEELKDELACCEDSEFIFKEIDKAFKKHMGKGLLK